MDKVTASIVTYKTDLNVLRHAVESFQNSSITGKLTIIDNSPTEILREECKKWKVDYLHSAVNVGYGRAHNIAMKESLDHSKYHLVLNPDVYFERDTIEKLYWFMEERQDAGLAMPLVRYPDGRIQMLCKLLPTPLNLAARRFFSRAEWSQKINERYELAASNYNQIINVPFLSGCFMFLRTAALKRVGLFDERFFLYAEDTDLSRRINQQFETLFYPMAEIFHVHERGSYKNFEHTLYNLKSAILYFNKWGWIYDPQRKEINHNTLLRLNR